MYKFSFVVLVLCLGGALADDYLSEIGEACKSRSDMYTCGKFEVLKYINSAAVGVPSKTVATGTLSLVNIDNGEPAQTVFPNARQLSSDSEFNKFFKFVFRQVNTFMNNRAIAVTIPENARLIDVDDGSNEIVSEARGKKRKVMALIPLLILFKLVKIKVMLAIALVGVLFIKKAVILLGLLAPSYFHALKMCKGPHISHHEIEDYGSTGYGFAHAPHPHGGYEKSWAASRAYNAYKQ